MKRKLQFLFLIVLVLLVSCGPKTRTITPLSESDKSGIKKVAILVHADEELKVSISKMKLRWYDGVATSSGEGIILILPVLLVAIIVDQSVRSNIDNKKAEEFREDMSDIKMDSLLSERIDQYFETFGIGFEAEIVEIQNPSILAQQGFDTLLNITVEKFEVKLCPKPLVYGVSDQSPKEGSGPPSSDVIELQGAISRWNVVYPKYSRMTTSRQTDNRSAENLYGIDTKKVSKEESEELGKLALEIMELSPVIAKYPIGDTVRTWITFKGKMISTRDGRVLWEREELHYDPKCERVEEMQSNPELVVDMLTRAIGDIAVNTVNEIQ